MLRLRVTPAAEKQLRGGHPWLFAGSVREQNREGASGELAAIYDRHDRFLAIGLYDPESPLRVRVLHAGKPETIDAAWWRRHLDEAIARRAGLFDERTTGYRCINGESDGWPGLVLDRYGDTHVLKIYTSAWLNRLDELKGLVPPGRLVFRKSRNLGDGEGEWLAGKPGPVEFLESGLRFEADVVRGQKTGFFLDQRENRRRVEALAAGREVLNAFSFTGGFSLYAARGGAKSVVEVDVSQHALEASKRNHALNRSQVKKCRFERIKADAFDWLESNAARRFDLVILDPPSFAKRETERAQAVRAYGKLAARGFELLRPGGVLVAASCSSHVTSEEFFGAVRAAAGRCRELGTTRHPPDHPAAFPEAEYLKCILMEKANG